VCCKQIHFHEKSPPMQRDLAYAGAWRALDLDLSGYITLREIDEEASDTLLSFKQWCDEEFGGVRSAFAIFDEDHDGDVSFREFRRACRTYGYEFDIRTLYEALDMDKQGSVCPKELMFLDDWESVDFTEDKLQQEQQLYQRARAHAVAAVPEAAVPTYVMEGPGPGAYALPPMLGSGPVMPTLRFSGAFSFRKKLGKQGGPLGLRKDMKEDEACGLPGTCLAGPGREIRPSPCSHNPRLEPVAPSKPSWGWGHSVRKSNESSQDTERRYLQDGQKRLRGRCIESRGSSRGGREAPEPELSVEPFDGRHPAPMPHTTPGPGLYSPRDSTYRRGAAVSCSPRRPLAVHPLFRDSRNGLPVRRPP